jgi:hypothetical protein
MTFVYICGFHGLVLVCLATYFWLLATGRSTRLYRRFIETKSQAKRRRAREHKEYCQRRKWWYQRPQPRAPASVTLH